MARPEKEAAVQDITEILEKAQSVFVTDYRGLNVEKMEQLRSKFREASVSYRVVKNTLGRRAAKNAGYDSMVEYLQGPSAIAYSFDDPSAPARVIQEFAKKEEKPVIKMSIFEGTFYGPDKIEAIAALPSKQELLSQLVRVFNAPMQGFAGSLSGLLRKFAGTLDAVREKKENS